MSLFTLIAFAFACAGTYYLCPSRFKWVLLLLVSYIYYAYCGVRALPFMLLTTLSTWGGALVISAIGWQQCPVPAAAVLVPPGLERRSKMHRAAESSNSDRALPTVEAVELPKLSQVMTSASSTIS